MATGKKEIDLRYGKIPPQDIEIEQAVIGACLLEPDTFSLVSGLIKSPECFYKESHKNLYQTMYSLAAKGTPIDLLTISEELRKSGNFDAIGGMAELIKISNSVLSSAHVESHSLILLEYYMKRELIRISGQVIAESYEHSTDVFSILESTEKSLSEITLKNIGKVALTSSELAKNAIDKIVALQKSTATITGVPTGFKTLNIQTSGWQNTDLIILAARPSVGKTAFCLNLCLNAASENRGVALFSLEMGAGQCTNRMISSISRVELWKFTGPRAMDINDMTSFNDACRQFSALKIFIDDEAGITLMTLRAKARKLKQKHNIGLIVIDYLQLMQGDAKSGNREQEISTISRGLKALAKELEVPIIALSQLNRASEKTGDTPKLSDLRESGAIEQDADMVMFLTRPDYQQDINKIDPSLLGKADLHIAKFRNGTPGITIPLEFNKEIQLFNDPYSAPSSNQFPVDNPRAGFQNRGNEKPPQNFWKED